MHSFVSKGFLFLALLFISLGINAQKAKKAAPNQPSDSKAKTAAPADSIVMRPSGYLMNIARYNTVFPQEKVYVQFDNTSYFAGETIYFKAWVLRATSNYFTDLSKVLYVELISSNGSVITTSKLKVEKGQCSGSILLDDTLSASDYRIRAYTRWQQNFSTDNMFMQVFPIYSSGKAYSLNYSRQFKKGINTDSLNLMVSLSDKAKSPLSKTKVKLRFSTNGINWETFNAQTDEDGMANVQYLLPAIKKNKSVYMTVSYMDGIRTNIEKVTIPLLPEKLTVDFLPEGGNCVVGLESKFAFKAIDESGQKVDVKGAVYENDTTLVLSFQSIHQGMGSFKLTPKPGCKYSARVWSSNRNMGKKAWAFALPKALESGYIIQCEPLDNSFSVRLIRSKGLPNENLGFVVQSGGKPIVYYDLNFERDSLFMMLPFKKLWSGVNQITLFNTKGEPLTERLIFVQKPNETLIMDVKTGKKSFNPREMITASISAVDTSGNTVPGEFAVAVRDISTEINRSAFSENLISSLLLTSDLKGPIRNPNYYLKEGNEEAVDLLLQTQGWRRYIWKQQITGKAPADINFKVERGIVINGSVKSLFTNKPLPNYEMTMLLHLDSVLYADVAKTDANGDFSFVCDYQGTRDLQLQSRKRTKNSETQIMLNREPAPISSVLYSTEQAWKEFKKPEDRIKGSEAGSNPAAYWKPESGALDTVISIKEIMVESKISTMQEFKEKSVFSFSAEKVRDNIRDKGKLGYESNLRSGLFQMLEDMDRQNFSIVMDDEGNISGIRYKGKKVVIINGSFSKNEESELDPLDGGFTSNDIENVMVIVDPQVIGTYTQMNSDEFGAVVVYSLYADGKKRREPIGIRNTKFDGYSLVKEFYAPDYSVSGNIPDPDRRRTLYWNPSVRTDSKGNNDFNALIRFFNNDTANQFEYTIEGFSDKGMPGSITKQNP